MHKLKRDMIFAGVLRTAGELVDLSDVDAEVVARLEAKKIARPTVRAPRAAPPPAVADAPTPSA